MIIDELKAIYKKYVGVMNSIALLDAEKRDMREKLSKHFSLEKGEYCSDDFYLDKIIEAVGKDELRRYCK